MTPKLTNNEICEYLGKCNDILLLIRCNLVDKNPNKKQCEVIRHNATELILQSKNILGFINPPPKGFKKFINKS